MKAVLFITSFLLIFCLFSNLIVQCTVFSFSELISSGNEKAVRRHARKFFDIEDGFLRSSLAAVTAENWNKTFGGLGSDWAYDVEVTSDGGYIIAGSTNSSGAGCFDFWVVKTDMNGNELWNKTYGGTGDDWAFGIAAPKVISPVGEAYVIAGATNSSGAGDYDAWLVKIDPDGNQLWNRTYGGIRFDTANDVEFVPGGGYILAGSTYSFSAIVADFWLVRVDSDGNELWNRTFNGPGHDIDSAYDVELTPDGGYILAGVTYLGGAMDQGFWLVKTDSNGNKEWDRMFYPGPGQMNKAFGVAVSADGGYAVVGTAYDKGKIWLVKTDSNGNHEWNKTYSIAGWDSAIDIESTLDGGYIIAGCFGGDFGLIKTDDAGAQQWTISSSDGDLAVDVELAPNGGYIVAGITYSGTGGEYDADFWLVRFKVHDIAVTYVKPSKSIVVQGFPVFINVTVENQGDYTETINVAVYASETTIALKSITLTSGNFTTITFKWDTTGFALGNYVISAYAWSLPNEIDTADNRYFDGTVQVVSIIIRGPYRNLYEIEYWIVASLERRPVRLISNIY